MSKSFVLRALGITSVVIAIIVNSPAATTTVRPTTGISASSTISSNVCSGKMWSCVDDPLQTNDGDGDGDATYVFTATSGQHTIGFTGYTGITSITRATLHVIARTTSGGSTDTVTMKFFNNGTIAGTGGAKTLTSTYHEYVSDFTTSISDVSNITMEVDLADNAGAGDVRYTAAWIDIAYGGAGTTLDGMESCLRTGTDISCTPPSSSITYKAGGCDTCAGNAGAQISVSDDITSPAVRNGTDNISTQIVVSPTSGLGTGTYPSELEWIKFPGPSTADTSLSIKGDWWVYLDNTANNKSQALEFDLFWGNGSYTGMFGTHCNQQSGTWQLDAQDGRTPTGWVDIIDAQSSTNAAIPCSLSKGAWHHITWEVHHDDTTANGGPGASGNIYYDYLTIDSTKYIVGVQTKVRGYRPSITWDTIGSQVQQTLDFNNDTLTEWVDAMSLTYWP